MIIIYNNYLFTLLYNYLLWINLYCLLISITAYSIHQFDSDMRLFISFLVLFKFQWISMFFGGFIQASGWISIENCTFRVLLTFRMFSNQKGEGRRGKEEEHRKVEFDFIILFLFLDEHSWRTRRRRTCLPAASEWSSATGSPKYSKDLPTAFRNLFRKKKEEKEKKKEKKTDRKKVGKV